MKLRKEDVNLEAQLIKYKILKGTSNREVYRPIKTCVIDLWTEIIQAAAPGQYLFSRDLKPGDSIIRLDQIKRRWRNQVQDKKTGLGINKTWYSLKHLNTDAMAADHGTLVASSLNQHNETMTVRHYAVNQQSRINEEIKNSRNTFE